MSSEEEPVAWLRKQIEADLAAAKIISSGGFSPERWDTEPPGQVNPENIADSEQVNAALGLEPEDFPAWSPSWVQLAAYSKLNNEPDEKYGRDSDAPFALVNNGRREFEHIIRHDPRNVAADCEAKLAILDEHRLVLADHGEPHAAHREYRIARDNPTDKQVEMANMMMWSKNCHACRSRYPCRTVRLLAGGYKHRPGYKEEDWKQ